ncbi:glycosyltransferase [Nocardioides sp.]|uniref:glycosyltransferase n=1 Tax=Nocardioides sp. TaxID=35761 RepID=UPI00262F3CBD|nr:glycosyltransferase [Nocardioides sp.]
MSRSRRPARPTDSKRDAASPVVSVLVPTYQGHDRITGCLDSLAFQTLALDQFEVVVVSNGPRTGTAEVVERWCEAHPGFRLRFEEREGAGEAYARNEALAAARGRFVTFVDDDDRVAPRYLEALLASGGPDVVSGVLIAHAFDGDFDNGTFDTDFTRVMRAHEGGTGEDLAIMAGSAWAKLLDRRKAAALRFDEELRLGCDTDYLVRYLNAYDVRLAVAQDPAAAYFVDIRRGSMMKHGEELPWADVEARIRTTRALESIEAGSPLGAAAREFHVWGSWNSFLGPYARQSPEALARLQAEVERVGLREFHWRTTRGPVTPQPTPADVRRVLDQARAAGADGADSAAHPGWEQVVRPYLIAHPDQFRALSAEAAAHGVLAPWDAAPDLDGLDLSTPRLAVVVPCHRSAATIVECLDSLGDQTVPAGAVEIVVVPNGPEDGARALIEAWAAAHPEIPLSVVDAPHARTAAAARNAGLAAVSADYVTFVDSDDVVRPRFAAALLSQCAPLVIACTVWEEMGADAPETLSFHHPVGLQGLNAMARRADIEELDWYLRPTHGKAVATDVARAVGFDEALATGEDTLFWLSVYARGSFDLRVASGGVESAYVYVKRADGLSAHGGTRTWEASGEACVATLTRICALPFSRRVQRVVDAQLGFVARWYVESSLCERPAEAARLHAALVEAGIADRVPWTELMRVVLGELVIGSGREAAATLATAGIDRAIALATISAAGVTVPASVEPFVGDRIEVSGASLAWGELGDVLTPLLEYVVSRSTGQAPVTRLTSLGSDPFAHVLAALIKVGRPELTWQARIDTAGAAVEPRPVADDGLVAILAGALVEAGYAGQTVPEEMGALAALVAAHLADTGVAAADADLVSDSGAGTGPQISVIVPTYRGQDRIATCLDDLAAQSLDPALFEVVVVQNGPACDTPRIVREWAAAHRAMTVRLIETEVASAQSARNLALDGPTAPWIAFVDDDDRLEPGYLEALWDAARPGTIPFGRVALVADGRLDERHEEVWLNAVPRRFLRRPADNADLWPAINPAWGKLAERAAIGEVRFDPELRYADDTVFWMEVLATSGARLGLTDFRDGSTYLWVQREGTITRSGLDDWTVHVERKVAAIAAMQRVAGDRPGLIAACDAVCDVFWPGVVAYAEHYPAEHDRVTAAVADSGVRRVPAAVVTALGEACVPAVEVTPVVTCLVVAHDYAEFVGAAIDSVLAQTGFAAGEVEVIVVDDGSTDATPEVLAGYGDAITVLRQANAGPTVAMYAGLDAARGEYVAFLDADDAWLPGRLAATVEHLRRHPEVGLVHSDMTIVDAAGSVLRPSLFGGAPLFRGRVLGDYLVSNQATTSSITMRTEIARTAPRAPGWAWCRDWWLAVHTAQDWEIAVLAEPLVLYRRHERNVNGLIGHSDEQRLRLLRRDLRVRRLLLTGVDLSSAPTERLVEAVGTQLTGMVTLLGLGIGPDELFEVTDADRLRAADHRRQALAQEHADRAAALSEAVRAVALDPASQENRDLFSRLASDPAPQDRRADVPVAAVVPSPRTADPSSRGIEPFVASVYVDELAVAPALLTCWCEALDREQVSLRLLAVGMEAEQAEQVVLAAMAETGIDPHGHRDFELVLCHSTEHAEAEVREGSQMLLTANRVSPALAGVRATHDAAVIKSCAVRWWSK